MKKEKRENIALDAFITNGFSYKGINYKDITAKSMRFLQKLDSPIYNGQYTEDNWIDTVLQYCFVTSKTNEEIFNLINDYENVINDYADEFDYNDLKAITPMVAEKIQALKAVSVETPDDEKKSVTNHIG